MPFLVGEAHRYAEPIDVKDVEAFLGMMDDVGAKMGVIVCPKGYSAGAQRRAAAASLKCHVVTIEEARHLNLLTEARIVFPEDWAFHEDMAQALKALRDKDTPSAFSEALEPIPFDEWERLARYALARYPQEARDALLAIAFEHLDDGWRYNAIMALDERGLLSEAEILSAAEDERDGENRAMLLELILYRSRPTLISMASGHPDSNFRYEIVDFINRCGCLSADELIIMATNETDPEILELLSGLRDEDTSGP